MLQNVQWICPVQDFGECAPCFAKTFSLSGTVKSASLSITAMGVYEAEINGSRVGSFILAPGWTAYHSRLQVQTYDVTGLLASDNRLLVTVGKGWYRGRIPGWTASEKSSLPCGLIAQLTVLYEDGRTEMFSTDESWTVCESAVRFSEIYDGEIYDASFEASQPSAVRTFDGPSHTLIPQEGEEIREQERLSPARLFTTPKGETVIDFGQNLTGYVSVTLSAKKGDEVDLSFAEVLDREGNFYTENYRSAKAQYHYICRGGEQTYTPRLTFWGFRYVRINAFPGEIRPEAFTAIVLHSAMKRTGYLSCSDPLLNQLFSNVIWGQKGNFVDVPTDCPQRDERLGWTGDAQVFARTACLNYDAETFFAKWLGDMAADQHEDGYVGHVIPDVIHAPKSSAAWGDAAAVCPWEVYQAYGNKELLAKHFDMMHRWVDYVTSVTATPFLWTGGEHFGDWLGLDAPTGSYKGSSREEFIASAFYAHSCSLVIRAGKELGMDVSAYEALYENIVKAFQSAYPEYRTQTECVLAAHFRLAPDPAAAAAQLAGMVKESGVQLKTGFVGTPYLLHVLSDCGYHDLAWSLLLRTEYPSWLYPVTKGATTIWEHWDGIMQNGGFWSADMNSFNHYAYGSVADWVYGVAAGIQPAQPGYERISIAPHPDERLGWLSAELRTRRGVIRSAWKRTENVWRYEMTVPVEAEITIGGVTRTVRPGSYIFYQE